MLSVQKAWVQQLCPPLTRRGCCEPSSNPGGHLQAQQARACQVTRSLPLLPIAASHALTLPILGSAAGAAPLAKATTPLLRRSQCPCPDARWRACVVLPCWHLWPVLPLPVLCSSAALDFQSLESTVFLLPPAPVLSQARPSADLTP